MCAAALGACHEQAESHGLQVYNDPLDTLAGSASHQQRSVFFESGGRVSHLWV